MTARIPFFCIALIALVVGATWAEPVTNPMRLILNHSADSLFECVPFEAPLDASSSKDVLVDGYQKLIDRYVGTNVSHIFFNVNFQRVAYDSDVCETYWDCPDPETDTSSWPLKSWYVFKAGVDPFRVCIERCREKGFWPWTSVRMNDTHYHDEQHKVFSLWWDHPEYRRGVSGFHDGFDFAVGAVREYYLKLIREVLERYATDGLELDWMRFPYHFKPGREQAGLEILTAFTREVRKLTEEWATRRGHAIKLAARVPSTPDMAEALGMDAVRWVREGLVDVLIPCATWKPSDTDLPLEVWRERVGEKAPPYVLAAGADLWLQGVPGGSLMKDNLESQRGFTAAMLHRGADCIYLFNHFNHSDFRHEFAQPNGSAVMRDEYRDILSDAGDLEAATSGSRRHVLTFRDTSAPGVKNPRPLPFLVDREHPATLRLHTGPKPESGRVTLRAGLEQREGLWETTFFVRANGTDCKATDDLNKPGQFVSGKDAPRYKYSVAEVAPRVAQFDVPLAAMRPGNNTFEIALAEGKPQKLTWLEVHVAPAD